MLTATIKSRLSEEQIARDKSILEDLLSLPEFRKEIIEKLKPPEQNSQFFGYSLTQNFDSTELTYSYLGAGYSRSAWLVTLGTHDYFSEPLKCVVKISERTADDYNTLFHELIGYISGIILERASLHPILLPDNRILSCGQYYKGAHLDRCSQPLPEIRDFSFNESFSSAENFVECAKWGIVDEAISVWEKLKGRFIIDPHQAQFQIDSQANAVLVDRGYFRIVNPSTRLSLERTSNILFPTIKTSEGEILDSSSKLKEFFFDSAGLEQTSFPVMISRLIEELDSGRWVSDLDMGRRYEASQVFDRMSIIRACSIGDYKLTQRRESYLKEYLEWSKTAGSRADKQLLDLIKKWSLNY